MKPKSFLFIGLLMVMTLVSFSVTDNFAQAPDEEPEVVTLKSQYDDLQRRTRIYEGFRAVREDMFQEIKKQSLDSLAASKQIILTLEANLLSANNQIKELQENMAATQNDLDQALSEINSIGFFGKQVSKTFYNVLLWSIIGALVFLGLAFYLLFFNARRLSRQRAFDLHDVLEEYENYRKTSRERLEKITIDHFNEIKKLKGL
jgi:preprotein translocase subunit SecF